MTRRTPKPRDGRGGGFTLLEVILAVTLAAGLIGAVYAHYRHTLGMREALQQQANTVLAQGHILDMITEDVQSAVTSSTLQMGLSGGADNLSFARAVVPSQAVYLKPRFIRTESESQQEPGMEDLAFEPQHDIQLVSYRLKREPDEEGVEQILGLERLCQRTVLAETAEEGTNIETVLLSQHIKLLHLQYWDGQQWTETWDRGSLPQAVRIDLGMEPLEEGQDFEDYPHETMWRVVAIPAGVAAGEAAQAQGGPTR